MHLSVEFLILSLFFKYSCQIFRTVMDDDDTDFAPPNPRSTGSNLASLFGFTKQPLQGNSSLTYSAPKAPKRETSPGQKKPEEKVKGQILLSKAVHAYKLVNRNYESQGVLGTVISGNHSSRIYEFILYKKTNERLIQIRISGAFIITLSPNNYVSFYDRTQNWSIRFGSEEDVAEFSERIAICKFFSQSETPSDVLIQDLEPASNEKTNANSTVMVRYNINFLTPEELSLFKADVVENIKLSSYNFPPLSKSLIDCAENCKRIIIIPYSLCGSWINELPSNKNVLIQIKIQKIIDEIDGSVTESKSSLDRRSESPIDSSVEETSVKARGASIKEALSSTKSQKAKLISRMARMGQATLPVKKGLSTGPSDSDEETTQISHPKPRVPRNRTAGNALSNSCSQTLNQETPQQLAVYQNDLAWHQAQLNKLGVAYQQVIPVSASPISSPTTDPNLSVYVSESRIQAAELRMGISKISEKLDLVWNKIQKVSGDGFESKPHQQALMDSGGVLASIQNIIAENESLKEKVEEQKTKIEQQNDRIFNLLELNHKYLEQNSTTHERQSVSESKLKTEMESLQKKEVEMEKAAKMAADRVKNLEEDLAKSESINKELKKSVEGLQSEIETLRRNLEGTNDEKTKEVETLREKMGKASETVLKFKEVLREVVSENESLKSVIQSQKEEIETGNQEMKDSRTKNEEYEKAVEGLKKKILDEETKTESKMDGLLKAVAKLEEENKNLLKKVEKEGDQKEKKSVLLKIFSVLKQEFSESKQYSSSDVLTIIGKIFNSEVSGSLKVEEVPETVQNKSVEPTVVPAPRTRLQTAEPKQEIKVSSPITEVESVKEDVKESSPLEESDGREIEQKESSSSIDCENKEETKEHDSQKKKDDDNRYKSYDQGWRTDKPPPPPLFDDDDDDDDYWRN